MISFVRCQPQYPRITASPRHKVTKVNCENLIRPSADMQHAWATSGTGTKADPAFNSGFGGPGGGGTNGGPKLHFGGDVAIPDRFG